MFLILPSLEVNADSDDRADLTSNERGASLDSSGSNREPDGTEHLTGSSQYSPTADSDHQVDASVSNEERHEAKPDTSGSPSAHTVHNDSQSSLIYIPPATLHGSAHLTTGVVENLALGAVGSGSPEQLGEATDNNYQGGTFEGTYGTLTVDSSGNYHYKVNSGSPAFVALGGGEPGTDTFVIAAPDGGNFVVNASVVGQNETAVITGDLSGAVYEDRNVKSGFIFTSGKLNITDQDGGEAKFEVASVNGAYGHLTIDESGNWSYEVNNSSMNVQSLQSGESLVDTIIVKSVDGTEQALVLSIGGSNENTATTVVTPSGSVVSVPAGGLTPALMQQLSGGQMPLGHVPGDAQISGLDVGSVKEDLALTAAGQLQVVDGDKGEAHFVGEKLGGTSHFGVLTIDQSGRWNYKLDNQRVEIQSLGAKGHESLVDSFVVHSADGTKHSITVTVNGTNDNPVIDTITAATATEGDKTATTGTITSTDIDTGDTAKYSAVAVPGFTLNADGSYSFDPTDAAYNGLAAGDTQQITIPVTVTDGSGGTDHKDLVITVTGTNDNPVLDQIQAQSVNEDGNQLTGQITSTDPDAHEKAIYSIANPVDGFTLNPDGSYTFDPSHASYQQLEAGVDQTLTIPITVTDQDGGKDTQNLVITVHGTQDSAQIAGTDAGSTTEETQLQATGQLTITDLDAGEAHFQDGDIVAAHGTLHLNADGSWTYDLDNTNPDVQALGTSASTTNSLTDTIEVQSADGTKHSITIMVNGTNDNPVIDTITAATATEGDKSATIGTITSTDIDTGDTAKYTTTATVAGFTLNADGSYSFDPTDAAYNGLAAGDTQQITIPVAVTDGSGGTDQKDLVITVTGTNDNPVLDQITAQSATEDGNKVTGTITSTDVDAHESATYSSPNIDGFSIDPTTGAYSFDPSHSAYQHLAAGQDQTVTIPVTVTDQSGGTDTQNLVITVHGTADTAQIAGVDTGVTTEESQLQATGQLTITDLDAGQEYFQVADIKASHGSLHLKADGSWTYDLDNSNPDVQALGTSASTTNSLTDTIEVQSADGTKHSITITVNGTNDNPVIDTITAATSTEGDSSATTGTITSTDIDTGDTAKYTTTATVAGFTLNADGSYSFDPTDAAYNG
ncbi:VCBS domain-containing protein, partial [Umboniibacter marinipuniceus]|uniref:VCBS domain-containing protein n=1 Tax=Umboniibacter marinipuniceus TaxID=569599 RepID=UPI001B864ECA